MACFLGPTGHPEHALHCELAFVNGTPSRPEDHKDYDKIAVLSTRLPISHVLIDGTLSARAAPTRTDFQLTTGARAVYLAVTRVN